MSGAKGSHHHRESKGRRTLRNPLDLLPLRRLVVFAVGAPLTSWRTSCRGTVRRFTSI